MTDTLSEKHHLIHASLNFFNQRKKYFIYTAFLLLPHVSIADDLCFEIDCLDCGESYQPQHIRIKDIGLSTFSGYVQANDDGQWGTATVAIIKGSSFIFSNDLGAAQYLYDIDLNSYDGNTAIGTRYSAKYKKNAGEIKTEFSVNPERQIQLVSTACS